MQIRSEKGNLTPTPSVTSKPLSWYVFDICFMNTVHGGCDGVWCGDVAKSYKLLWHLLQKFCKMGFWGSSGCLCTVVHCGFFSKHYRTGFVHPFPRWCVCVCVYGLCGDLWFQYHLLSFWAMFRSFRFRFPFPSAFERVSGQTSILHLSAESGRNPSNAMVTDSHIKPPAK